MLPALSFFSVWPGASHSLHGGSHDVGSPCRTYWTQSAGPGLGLPGRRVWGGAWERAFPEASMRSCLCWSRGPTLETTTLAHRSVPLFPGSRNWLSVVHTVSYSMWICCSPEIQMPCPTPLGRPLQASPAVSFYLLPVLAQCLLSKGHLWTHSSNSWSVRAQGSGIDHGRAYTPSFHTMLLLWPISYHHLPISTVTLRCWLLSHTTIALASLLSSRTARLSWAVALSSWMGRRPRGLAVWDALSSPER